jgi:hypothetical protein
MTTPLPLSDFHRADLRASGLSDAHIAAAGLYTEYDPAAVSKLLNWTRPAPKLGACLCFPYLAPDGAPTGYAVLKPSNPRERNDKPVKYESPKGAPLRVYVPPKTRAALTDPKVPLLVTEGAKKALKADQDGFACVGLSGVEGWSQKRARGADDKPKGQRELLPDLAAVAWAAREVSIVYDSDISSKPDVARAERHLAAALASVGARVKLVRLPPGPDGAKVGLDDYLLAHTPDELRALVAAAQTFDPRADAPAKAERPPSAAEVLVCIGRAWDLWHDGAGTAFATDGRRTLPVRGKQFRQRLLHAYLRATGKPPAGDALKTATDALAALAECEGPRRPVFVRVAVHNGRAYLHLADDADTVIEIDADGWRACADPPVRFRTPAGAHPLPVPERGGSLDELRAFVNVPDDGDFALLLAWLCGCLRADGPFPLLVLVGEQGTAKSTTARVAKRLLDPGKALVRTAPKEARDLMIAATNAWALAYDNVSTLPAWLSDALCQVATGGGFATRELYTDNDECILDAKRPVILNGISDFVTRGDLLERAVLLRHPPLPERARKPESELWTAFEAAHPRLLGALLDRVSAGFRALPHVALERNPRMLDFARFAAACERGSGDAPRFERAYAENQAGAHAQALDDSPVTGVLVAFMADRAEWHGKASELLAELAALVPNPPRDWPKRANVLSGLLKRLAPNLRAVHGLNVADGRGTDRTRARFLHLTRLPESGRESASALVRPSAPLPAPDDAADDDRPAGAEIVRPIVRTAERANAYESQCADAASDGRTIPDDVSPPLAGWRFGNDDRHFDSEGNRW